MSRCRCPVCCGDPLPTYTPQWRIECEARALLTLPLAERRKALAAPGRAARRQALEAEMRRQWQERREGP